MRSLFLKVFLSFWLTIAAITMGGHLVNRLLTRIAFFQFLYRSETGIPELFVAIALSGLPCLLLAHSLAGPIVQLRAATQALAEGNLAARAGRTLRRRRDEIGLLVGDFDHMAQSLESLLDAQKTLIADISHELRSPLTRLNLALELARRDSGIDGASALDRAERETRRLNELISKLLVLSLLDGGAETIQRSVIQIEVLVGDLIADADFEARIRSRAVRAGAMEPCTTMGNSDLLRSAVENVLRNAVQYTAEGTEVLVSVRVEGMANDSVAVIEVSDHGPGVPEAELLRLFRPFYRSDPARARDAGGTGLGLAITQRALELHQGSVSAHNLPDTGLVVRMRIPAVSRTAAAGST